MLRFIKIDLEFASKFTGHTFYGFLYLKVHDSVDQSE